MEPELDILLAALHPVPYPRVMRNTEGVPLLLADDDTRFGTTHVLAVAPYTEQPAISQLGRLRRAADTATDASFFSGCGLIVLWIGPEERWRAECDRVGPDLHGLRSTIVQGLAWLDPESGKYHLRRSRWGPFKFGKRVEPLRELLQAWPGTDRVD